MKRRTMTKKESANGKLFKASCPISNLDAFYIYVYHLCKLISTIFAILSEWVSWNKDQYFCLTF